MNFKIGFPCMRFPQHDDMKVGSSALTHLRSLPHAGAVAKLEGMALKNSHNILNFVQSVANEPEHFRMVRLGSIAWPAYDTEFGPYDVSESIKVLNRVRDIARSSGVRLSCHPSQYHALASDRVEVVANTILSLNIFGFIAQQVGITEINIHCWGRGGVDAFRDNMKYLEPCVLSRLTVENDEFGVGLYELPRIGLPLVFDPHHHFINTGDWGTDADFELVASTWNRKPKMHYSYPRNCTLKSGWPEIGKSRTATRAHSDTYNNVTVSRWILNKAEKHGFDIMCEAKHKDIARNRLYEIYTTGE
jgi:UV DNA damage repair endonuclease